MTSVWREERTETGRVLRAGETGPHVVLVHGLEDRPETWTAVAERLAPTCQVTAPEMPWLVGGSYTWLSDGSPRSWLSTTLDELGLAGAHLVGHSFGGHAILAHLADGGASAGALLVAPLYRTQQELALADCDDRVRRALVDTVIEGLHLRLGARLDVVDAEELRIMDSSLSRDVVERAFPSLMACLLTPPPIRPEAVRAPLRVVVRRGDPSLSTLAAAELCRAPRTTVLELEGDGHFLHLIDPGDVAARVLDLVAATTAHPVADRAAADPHPSMPHLTQPTREGTIPCPTSY